MPVTMNGDGPQQRRIRLGVLADLFGEFLAGLVPIHVGQETGLGPRRFCPLFFLAGHGFGSHGFTASPNSFPLRWNFLL